MKCTKCNGCIWPVLFENKIYRYCSFCRDVYSTQPGGYYTLVKDQRIIDGVFALVGNKV